MIDSVSQNGVSTSATATSLLSSGNLRPAGVLGGAQIGANYEFVPWVIGVEGSWTDSTISGSTLIACSVCPATVAQERFTSHALWFAAVLAALLRGIAALMRWQKPNVLTMFVETEGSWRVP